MISAPPYTGKSLVLGAMMLSLDFGLPLFGKLPPQGARKVLAFLQDAPPWDYAEQIRKLSRGMNLTDDLVELSELNVYFGKQDGSAHRITDSETYEKIELHKPDVIIFDAFWTTHDFNELDKVQMKPVMQLYKGLRDRGHSVIFTHHDKKPQQDSQGTPLVYRSSGSHVISAACDNQLFLSRRAGGKIAIQAGKARGGSGSLHTVEIAEVEHRDGEAIALRLLDDSETRSGKLLSFVREGERTRGEVIEYLKAIEPRLKMGTAARAVDKTLAMLAQNGKVERVGYGKWKGKD